MSRANYEKYYYHAKIEDAQMRLGFWQAKHSAALAEIHCQSRMASCAMEQVRIIQQEIAEYQQMMNVERDVDAKARENVQETAEDTPNDDVGDREADEASVS